MEWYRHTHLPNRMHHASTLMTQPCVIIGTDPQRTGTTTVPLAWRFLDSRFHQFSDSCVFVAIWNPHPEPTTNHTKTAWRISTTSVNVQLATWRNNVTCVRPNTLPRFVLQPWCIFAQFFTSPSFTNLSEFFEKKKKFLKYRIELVFDVVCVSHWMCLLPSTDDVALMWQVYTPIWASGDCPGRGLVSLEDCQHGFVSLTAANDTVTQKISYGPKRLTRWIGGG